MRFAVRISYRGESFHGWQKQIGHRSIQQVFEEALAKITGETAPVTASGRTDSGVHARAQVAHFDLTRREWTPRILERALNAHLPMSIRILDCVTVDGGFHAQRSALRKQYSYYIQQGPTSLPYWEPYTWWNRKNLNVEAMSQAIQCLIGKHDFKAFQAAGSSAKTSVREIYEAQVTREIHLFDSKDAQALRSDWPDFHLIRIRLVGSGFLKQMVRGIVGSLREIGEEYRPVEALSEALSKLDRNLVGPTAPGKGLWLERVEYGQNQPRELWLTKLDGLE